jgi:hypothetical protein
MLKLHFNIKMPKYNTKIIKISKNRPKSTFLIANWPSDQKLLTFFSKNGVF